MLSALSNLTTISPSLINTIMATSWQNVTKIDSDDAFSPFLIAQFLRLKACLLIKTRFEDC